MPDSKDVADHYAAKRHVPDNQVIGLKLPTTETMTRAEYQNQLENPLLQFLDAQKLLVFVPDTASTNNGARKLKEAKIRYAVLCYGVPLRIGADANLKEHDEVKWRPQLRDRNDAAVDSELCLLPWTNSHHMLAGYIPNPCYCATNAAAINPAKGVLMVARLDGPDAAIARRLWTKRWKLKGTAYGAGPTSTCAWQPILG